MFADLIFITLILINRLKLFVHEDRMDRDTTKKSSIINQREIELEDDPGIIGGIKCKLL